MFQALRRRDTSPAIASSADAAGAGISETVISNVQLEPP